MVKILSQDEKIMLAYLTDKPAHIDKLAKRLEWSIARCSGTLGLLEWKKLCERESGMRFKLHDSRTILGFPTIEY